MALCHKKDGSEQEGARGEGGANSRGNPPYREFQRFTALCSAGHKQPGD